MAVRTEGRAASGVASSATMMTGCWQCGRFRVAVGSNGSRSRTGWRDDARLADLLEADPDIDALSFYPHLLAWEIAQIPVAKRPTLVVLLDTFEDVGDRTHRDLERLLQRVVWLMPNAVFLITSRSRLQWTDPGLQGQLDFTGPAAWPGLAAGPVPPARTASPAAVGGGRRQVLIGDFSAEDCEDYLCRDQERILPDHRSGQRGMAPDHAIRGRKPRRPGEGSGPHRIHRHDVAALGRVSNVLVASATLPRTTQNRMRSSPSHAGVNRYE
ncbi:hypothetical protein CFP59_09474 [Streptomyces malaysiensis subsp. malaysiensis]|uniref:hypothetical protein n=1 Tax=Streptomyces malaysiensis TaxID=92644 RepID=UPI000CA2C3FF|nr:MULTISPECIES: hypothetical protein [unclassified Streptomyces]AUA17280.1 hypothetical protein CFP59_09474 [Streptomyces sp. M56]